MHPEPPEKQEPTLGAAYWGWSISGENLPPSKEVHSAYVLDGLIARKNCGPNVVYYFHTTRKQSIDRLQADHVFFPQHTVAGLLGSAREHVSSSLLFWLLLF